MRQLPRLQWWVWALVCLVGLAITILAVWKLPSLLYGDVTQASTDARLQAASSFRTVVVAGLAGLAALGSLAIANRTYRLTQQGQITDRYSKAIEQLGDDKLDVRLGGIYALERIATDSERDHPTVVEVLSAFVREHSQPSTVDDDSVGDGNSGPLASPPEPVKREPTTDVQAAVTVLGRLPQRRPVSRGDLDGAHLEGANLQEAHLEGAQLLEAHLQGASLDGAYLLGTVLERAHLEGGGPPARAPGGGVPGDGDPGGGAAGLGAPGGGEPREGEPEGGVAAGGEPGGGEPGGGAAVGTNLRGANLDGAQLQGATYDADTVWPDGFDWKAAGVREES